MEEEKEKKGRRAVTRANDQRDLAVGSRTVRVCRALAALLLVGNPFESDKNFTILILGYPVNCYFIARE